jgi:Asparagine synthase
VAVRLPAELNPLGLEPVELAGCRPWGHAGGLVRPADGPQPGSPREALEQSLAALLERGPCVVAFSGGRDSSALLAVAVHVARREGLEPPAVATIHFDGSPRSDESGWRRLVLDHLKLRDGELIDGRDGRMDFIGPLARDTLLRFGLLYPHHAFMYRALVERAAGATLITGLAGDELFTLWRLEGAAAVLRGARPRAYDLRELALAAAPRALRRKALTRLTRFEIPWLAPAGLRAVRAARAAEMAQEPPSFGRRLRWWPRRRAVRAMERSMRLFAQAAGAGVAHPLMEPRFVCALASRYGMLAPRGRTEAWSEMFGDLLPRQLVERTTKAWLTDMLWERHSRAFASGWDGLGVDPELVDTEGLRGTWQSNEDPWRPAMLMQALWLNREVAAG